MAIRDVRSYFSLEGKENNTDAQSLKVNSTPDLVKSSEHVIIADAEAVNKELKTSTSF